MNISGYAESNFRYGKGPGVAAVSVFCGNAGYRSEEDPVGYWDFCFAFRREFFPLVHNTQRRDLCAHFYIRMNIWIPLTA